ncbi:alpha/beta fold hydrolase [Patulibacter minatonensis]|uniref:alpha/beta fold hydrolase n=1 Tax=Patulibacter minatonensis TaxID=298163 RepID=UPI000685B33B|nr:alpha/beta hydrolase [Patulibacter minatonensis]
MTRTAPDPGLHELRHATSSAGARISYVHEGRGGIPLLLVHGWPETSRIWWRTIAPLAAAGFEVIVPDLRGFGTDPVAPDGHYDATANARDLHDLVHGELGHAACFAVGSDFGGVVVQELGQRFPGFVAAQCLFNTVLPHLRAEYDAAGLRSGRSPRARASSDYFLRQGTDADGLMAELDTPERRRRYVAEMYGHRHWGTPGGFTPEEVAFVVEPFGDAARLRASFGLYEVATGTREPSEPPLPPAVSAVPTVALHGPDDHVIWQDFPERCEVAFSDLTGPYVIPRAGHFLQWERPELLARTISGFLGARFALPG